jgi:divalent metal cation (Fe/Co/Zn/Cd) transporter
MKLAGWTSRYPKLWCGMESTVWAEMPQTDIIAANKKTILFMVRIVCLSWKGIPSATKVLGMPVSFYLYSRIWFIAYDNLAEYYIDNMGISMPMIARRIVICVTNIPMYRTLV